MTEASCPRKMAKGAECFARGYSRDALRETNAMSPTCLCNCARELREQFRQVAIAPTSAPSITKQAQDLLHLADALPALLHQDCHLLEGVFVPRGVEQEALSDAINQTCV